MKNLFTVREAQEYLKTQGVDWTQVWIRLQIGAKKIKSEKKFNARLIRKTELDRILRERESNAVVQASAGRN